MIVSITHKLLVKEFTELVSETNGITLIDTLDLLISSSLKTKNEDAYKSLLEFHKLLNEFITNVRPIQDLLKHPLQSHRRVFKKFPLKYNEEHIHLTGSLTADFIWEKLEPLLKGPHVQIYEQKIKQVYGESAWPITSSADVDKLIRLKETEGFDTYLKVLYITKLIFTSRKAHADAAYSMAKDLYHNYNVGQIRLKFSLSRSTSDSSEQIPGIDSVTSEDVVMGLYDGFNSFQKEHPEFRFILSPSFRKEASFFDASKYATRKEHFQQQIDEILDLIKKIQS